MIQHIDLNFGDNKKFNHYIVPFHEIHDSHPYPGIYSWYIGKSKLENWAENFAIFFEQLQLKSTVEGKNRFKYVGELNKVVAKSEFTDREKFTEELASAIMCINYPVYIGRSKNLRSRLMEHKKQINMHIRNDVRKNIYENSSITSDDKRESEFFGARMADLLKGKLDTECLYVKYIIATSCQMCKRERCSKCSLIEEINLRLQECEYLLNSLFNPVFGRR